MPSLFGHSLSGIRVFGFINEDGIMDLAKGMNGGRELTNTNRLTMYHKARKHLWEKLGDEKRRELEELADEYNEYGPPREITRKCVGISLVQRVHGTDSRPPRVALKHMKKWALDTLHAWRKFANFHGIILGCIEDANGQALGIR